MYERISLAIPGKLFVAGEYAVTRPGGRAMIAAIATDFRVTVAKSEGKSCLHTNVALADYEFSINHFDLPDNPWNFALAALQNLLALLPEQVLPEIRLTIESGLGFGATKTGYGSSASVVVGVVQGLARFFKWQLNPAELFKAAATAHQRVQGSGSMGDVAAIFAGGVSFYQKPDDDWQTWQIRTLSQQEWADFGWQPYIVKTGKAIKTGDKLKIDLPETFYQASDRLVDQLEKSFFSLAYAKKRFKQFKKLILKNQNLLIAHLPAAYLTDKLALALALINAQDNLVAKISGAGFGENLIVFASSDKNIKKIREKLGRQGMTLEKIHIAKERS